MATTDVALRIKLLNPGNLDALRGPYASLSAANAAIPSVVVSGVNYRQGKFVEIGTDGLYVTYWWKGGYNDANLVEYQIISDIEIKDPASFYNPDNNVVGYEVQSLGVIVARSSEIYTSSDVEPTMYITVSGLPPGATFDRYYYFFKANGDFISSGSIPLADTSKTILTPALTATMKINLLGRNIAGASDLEDVKFEYGTEATSYNPFVYTINDVPVYGSNTQSDLLNKLEVDIQDPNNFYDSENNVPGQEVSSTGTISTRSTEIYTEAEVGEFKVITISGLPSGATIARYYSFFKANGDFISSGNIAMALTQGTIITPALTASMKINLLGRNLAGASNLGSVKFQYGTIIEISDEKIVSIAGNELYSPPVLPDTSLKKTILFGDSITETVTSGGVAKLNWPIYAYQKLNWTWYNYARTGARFKDLTTPPTTRASVSVQIDDAITEHGSDDIGIIVFNLMTNDAADSSGTIGSYTTAMSKVLITDLDRTLFAEAVRYAFWKASLQWPNAKIYACTQLRRVTGFIEANTISCISILTQLAGFYNIKIIDQYNEAGISTQFEVNGAQGRYLTDGLHPYGVGIKLQGEYVASKILSSYIKI